MKEETIYVYLLDEGLDVWRPVKAIHIRDKIYKIVSENPDPEDEKWQFSAGDFVRCESKPLSDTEAYQDELVVVERIQEGST
jgi:hypothetical protein